MGSLPLTVGEGLFRSTPLQALGVLRGVRLGTEPAHDSHPLNDIHESDEDLQGAEIRSSVPGCLLRHRPARLPGSSDYDPFDEVADECLLKRPESAFGAPGLEAG